MWENFNPLPECRLTHHFITEQKKLKFQAVHVRGAPIPWAVGGGVPGNVIAAASLENTLETSVRFKLYLSLTQQASVLQVFNVLLYLLLCTEVYICKGLPLLFVFK